jgi:hypothetical protein
MVSERSRFIGSSVVVPDGNRLEPVWATGDGAAISIPLPERTTR